jgi:alanine dehydrogenase
VDVSVDQGGCIETTKPTTHKHPTYIINGVVHYSVANMPGAVGRTSTFALTNATFPYLMKIVNNGAVEAIRRHRSIATGVNVFRGHLTYEAVAETFKLPFTPVEHLVN